MRLGRSERNMNRVITTMMLGLTIGLLFSGACGGGEPAKIVFDLEIQDKVLSGFETFRVGQNDEVTLRWTTDEAVTIHIHGYDMKKKVIVDELAILQFTARATGRFLIEGHTVDVHKNDAHSDEDHVDDDHNDEAHVNDGFTLGYLEVMPR
jgi:hypothetical protein